MENQNSDINNTLKIKLSELVFRNDSDTGDFINYDEQKCNSCGACAMVCSVNLWAVPDGKKAALSPKYKERCMECAACYVVCDQDAIDFRYPDGGSGIIIKHG